MPTHVVHLEDDGPLQEILKVAFEAAEPNINFHQFVSGDDAMPYIQKHAQTIDLFVLDIRVPGSMSGLEVAQKIRDLKCPGVIVLTSAYAPPSRDLLVTLNAEYYPKPWHIFEVTQKLLQLAKPRETSAKTTASKDQAATSGDTTKNNTNSR